MKLKEMMRFGTARTHCKVISVLEVDKSLKFLLGFFSLFGFKGNPNKKKLLSTVI